MPHTIHLEDIGIRWVFTGEVGDQEMIDCTKDFYDDPKFLDFHYGIVDYLGVTQYNVSSETIFKIGQLDEAASQQNPHFKLAVIATNQLVKGLSRMYQLSGGASVWESKIFEDETAARKWLNG